MFKKKKNGEEDKEDQRHNRTSSGAIYIYTHNMSFLNRKPCRRVVVLALVLVVIPLSGRMFYVNKLEFARRMMMMSSSDGVRAHATAHEVIEEREKMVAKQHPREEEEEEEKRPPLEAPTT